MRSAFAALGTGGAQPSKGPLSAGPLYPAWLAHAAPTVRSAGDGRGSAPGATPAPGARGPLAHAPTANRHARVGPGDRSGFDGGASPTVGDGGGTPLSCGNLIRHACLLDTAGRETNGLCRPAVHGKTQINYPEGSGQSLCKKGGLPSNGELEEGSFGHKVLPGDVGG